MTDKGYPARIEFSEEDGCFVGHIVGINGNLMLRVPPEVHAAVARAAEVRGKSINQWAAEALAEQATK